MRKILLGQEHCFPSTCEARYPETRSLAAHYCFSASSELFSYFLQLNFLSLFPWLLPTHTPFLLLLSRAFLCATTSPLFPGAMTQFHRTIWECENDVVGVNGASSHAPWEGMHLEAENAHCTFDTNPLIILQQTWGLCWLTLSKYVGQSIGNMLV